MSSDNVLSFSRSENVVSADVKLTDSMILGFLEFHQIPEMSVPIHEMESLWLKHGLEQSFLDDIRPVNAFKRATRQAGMINNIEIDYRGKKHEAKLLVRNVVIDHVQVLQHLIREVIISEDEKPYYDSVGWMRFNRTNDCMDVGTFPGFEYEYNYQMILDNAQKLFEHFTAYHTRDTVRNLITKVVNQSNPTPIMANSHGKFIPKTYVQRFAGLQSLVEELREKYAPNTDCQVDLVPVVNTLKQRELFSRKAMIQLEDLADNLMSEFAEYMKNRPKIKLEVAQRMVRDAQDLIRRTNEYEQIMGVRMATIEQQLKQFVNIVNVASDEISHAS